MPEMWSIKTISGPLLWDLSIGSFWNQVIIYILSVDQALLPHDPLLLFGYENCPKHSGLIPPSSPTKWAHLCLLAARRSITKWTTSYSPNITNIKAAAVFYVYLNEKLDAKLNPILGYSLFLSKLGAYHATINSTGDVSRAISQ